MRLPQYFKRHRKSDDTPYEVSGAAVVMAGLILLFFAIAAGQAYLLRSGTLAAVIASSLVDLANGDRQSQGLAPLSLNPTLVAVAQAKANDMAAKGYFAHTSPEGHDPWYWFTLEGYNYQYAGENLAVDFTDSVTVEAAWMNSPEHRANLLNEHYTEVGIAIAKGTFNGHSTIFVAQEFGAPALAFAQKPVEESPAPPEAAPATTTPKNVAGTTTKKPSVGTPAASTTPTVASSAPTSTPIAATEAVTPAAPAVALTPTGSLGNTGDAPAAKTPWWANVVASPQTVLSWAYYLLAVATLLIFAYLTELELHRRHTRHALEAGGLLVLMLALFTLAQFLFFAHPALAAL